MKEVVRKAIHRAGILQVAVLRPLRTIDVKAVVSILKDMKPGKYLGTEHCLGR